MNAGLSAVGESRSGSIELMHEQQKQLVKYILSS